MSACQCIMALVVAQSIPHTGLLKYAQWNAVAQGCGYEVTRAT